MKHPKIDSAEHSTDYTPVDFFSHSYISLMDVIMFKLNRILNATFDVGLLFLVLCRLVVFVTLGSSPDSASECSTYLQPSYSANL